METEQLSDKDLYEKVKGVVVEVLKPNEQDLKPESLFIEDLGADSLDRVTMLMALEDAFGQEISDGEAERLVSIEETVRFIREKMASS